MNLRDICNIFFYGKLYDVNDYKYQYCLLGILFYICITKYFFDSFMCLLYTLHIFYIRYDSRSKYDSREKRLHNRSESPSASTSTENNKLYTDRSVLLTSSSNTVTSLSNVESVNGESLGFIDDITNVFSVMKKTVLNTISDEPCGKNKAIQTIFDVASDKVRNLKENQNPVIEDANRIKEEILQELQKLNEEPIELKSVSINKDKQESSNNTTTFSEISDVEDNTSKTGDATEVLSIDNGKIIGGPKQPLALNDTGTNKSPSKTDDICSDNDQTLLSPKDQLANRSKHDSVILGSKENVTKSLPQGKQKHCSKNSKTDRNEEQPDQTKTGSSDMVDVMNNTTKTIQKYSDFNTCKQSHFESAGTNNLQRCIYSCKTMKYFVALSCNEKKCINKLFSQAKEDAHLTNLMTLRNFIKRHKRKRISFKTGELSPIVVVNKLIGKNISNMECSDDAIGNSKTSTCRASQHKEIVCTSREGHDAQPICKSSIVKQKAIPLLTQTSHDFMKQVLTESSSKLSNLSLQNTVNSFSKAIPDTTSLLSTSSLTLSQKFHRSFLKKKIDRTKRAMLTTKSSKKHLHMLSPLERTETERKEEYSKYGQNTTWSLSQLNRKHGIRDCQRNSFDRNSDEEESYMPKHISKKTPTSYSDWKKQKGVLITSLATKEKKGDFGVGMSRERVMGQIADHSVSVKNNCESLRHGDAAVTIVSHGASSAVEDSVLSDVNAADTKEDTGNADCSNRVSYQTLLLPLETANMRDSGSSNIIDNVPSDVDEINPQINCDIALNNDAPFEEESTKGEDTFINYIPQQNTDSITFKYKNKVTNFKDYLLLKNRLGGKNTNDRIGTLTKNNSETINDGTKTNTLSDNTQSARVKPSVFQFYSDTLANNCASVEKDINTNSDLCEKQTTDEDQWYDCTAHSSFMSAADDISTTVLNIIPDYLKDYDCIKNMGCTYSKPSTSNASTTSSLVCVLSGIIRGRGYIL